MLQVFARTSARRSLGVNDFATDKSSVNLPVQEVAVGHQQERELGRNLTAHLFREERHRMRLAAALRMPEHAQLAGSGSHGSMALTALVRALATASRVPFSCVA